MGSGGDGRRVGEVASGHAQSQEGGVVGCEEEEERVWEGMGRELLGHGKRAGFQSESRGKPLQGRGVISALHF